MHKFTNKLVDEKSPYLQQHAHNPVQWYPWSEEAFEKARQEDKPIFLSIGYSTCHWCHVMEHESFEDEDVAALMNATFIAIKVDREERPDVDNVYMTVCHMMTGSGGWPLTIFMTPEKKPFFAATYIPKQSRFGRTGMMELIPQVQALWQNDRKRVYTSANDITGHLQSTATPTQGHSLSANLLEQTFTDLSRRFDPEKGGFNEAPKFPTPHNLLFLLRYYHRSQNDLALHMVEKTLTEMRHGGIYDHIGFGFHRYSTDKNWLLPHFEKMLYDQATLILAYTEAYQLTQKEEYAQTVREIITYVLRDMTSPDGGFYSAEDADSDGEEGKFYVWTHSELHDTLGDDAEWFYEYFQIKPDGNFVEEATHRKTGANILHRLETPEEFATLKGCAVNEFTDKLENARQKLFTVREERVHPYKDDKILTDWNGLMIAALATAGRVLHEPSFTSATEKTLAFINKNLTTHDGALLHRYRDGDAAIPAFIDDYAFTIWGLIELFQTTQNAAYLEQALKLNSIFINLFWDKTNGGFFSTPADGEQLLIRNKELYDGAIPSGNSIAMFNLVRLARLTGNSKFEDMAEELGRAFSASVSRQPSAYTFLLSALDFANGPSFEIVIVGDEENIETKKILDAINALSLPGKVVIFKKDDHSPINELSDFIKPYKSLNGKPTIYVCQDNTCQLPTTDINTMLQLLGKKND